MITESDIAVIGAGPAGCNAALIAAEYDFSVVMLDEQASPGGQVWREKSPAILHAPKTPESVAGESIRNAISQSNVSHLAGVRVWHIERSIDAFIIHYENAGVSISLHCRCLVIATGARETIQPIPGWTLPGVVGMAGATSIFKQDLIPIGSKMVVSGTGPLAFFVAAEQQRLGGKVAAVVTSNTLLDWIKVLPAMLRRPGLLFRGLRWVTALTVNRIPIYWGHTVTRVEGESSVSRVEFTKIGKDWSPQGEPRFIDCDCVSLGNGLIPAFESFQLAGISLEHRSDLGGWIPKAEQDGRTNVSGCFICGDGAGIRGSLAAQTHGKLAGLSAVVFLGAKINHPIDKLRREHTRAATFGEAMSKLSIPRPGLSKLTTAQTVVCRCEGITRAEIEDEINLGAQSTTAVKSGVRVGMGPCGGKYCQTAISEFIAKAKSCPVSEIVPPTARPPLRPVSVNTLAGDFDYSDLPISKPSPL